MILFLLVCLSSLTFLLFGWFIGFVGWAEHKGMIAAASGLVGAVVGSEYAYRRKLFEIGWDRLMWLGPEIGFAAGGAVGLSSDVGDLLTAIIAVLGAGTGAVVAKYLLRFFEHEPPPSIL